MKIILVNNSSDTFSYLSGSVIAPANGSIDVPSGLWKRLYADLTFLNDLRNSNLVVNDGVSNFRFPNSEDLIKYALASLKFDSVRKDFTYSTTQTNAVIWTPTSGKKFIVTDFALNIRNSSLGALSVSIFDDSNATGNFLYKANFESGANYDAVSNLVTEFVSSAINKSLKITTSGALMISGTIQGYETE